MAEVNPVTPVVTPAAPGTAIQTPPGEGSPPQYVTIEQHNAVLERLKGISGAIAGLSRTAPVTPATPTTPAPDATLIERVKAIEDQAKSLRESTRLMAVKTALVEGGVPAKKAEREARLILMDHGKQIEVSDTYVTTYKDGDKASPIQDWIGAFLKTDDGKTLLPSKSTVDAGGSGGQANLNTVHPFSALTYKQIMDHPDYSLRETYFKTHREEWNKKKTAR